MIHLFKISSFTSYHHLESTISIWSTLQFLQEANKFSYYDFQSTYFSFTSILLYVSLAGLVQVKLVARLIAPEQLAPAGKLPPRQHNSWNCFFKTSLSLSFHDFHFLKEKKTKDTSVLCCSVSKMRKRSSRCYGKVYCSAL